MMLGNSAQAPYDIALLGVLVAVCAVLLAGAVSAPSWPLAVAPVVRRGAMIFAIVAIAFVLIRTPSHDPFVSLDGCSPSGVRSRSPCCATESGPGGPGAGKCTHFRS